MKKYAVLSLLVLLMGMSSLEAQNSKILFGNTPKKIFVNNRILAKVNGKAISVMDIMKKMDMLFYRQYPQYANSTEARFQFYSMYWKNALQESIDRELVMVDAKEAKVEVSSGDIRQEMESIFGPNIIGNLDTAGITYEDAVQMIKEDMIMKRMLGGRVNAIAVRMVSPQAVVTAYEEYAKSSTKSDEWTYRVISIRGAETSETAELAYRLLSEEKVPLDNLVEKINAEKVTVKVSEEFKHSPKDISKEYNDILTSLEIGQYSKPTSQKSKVDQSLVYRIFFLKDIVVGKPKSFEELESRLKDKLTEEMINKETEKYIEKLRKHHHVSEELIKELVPDDFEPFALK